MSDFCPRSGACARTRPQLPLSGTTVCAALLG